LLDAGVPLFVDSQVGRSMQLFSIAGPLSPKRMRNCSGILPGGGEPAFPAERPRRPARFAFTDYLTGLRSRRFFEQQLDLELKRAQRHSQQFALLMVDIDHFKRAEHNLGHSQSATRPCAAWPTC